MIQSYYTFFSRQISLSADSAHEIFDVLCANACANLGYPTVLIYPQIVNNYWGLFNPFHPQEPTQEFAEFYSTNDQIKVATLPIPQLFNQSSRWFNPSTLMCKYYAPFFIFPQTQMVHTRDWNFAKAAVKFKIPVVYERHYFQSSFFEPEIVNDPYFKVAITQSELTKQSLIDYGMPAEKAIAMHNGCEAFFLTRQPEEAQVWRNELLKSGRQKLVIYSGALYPFKGVDLLIDVAALLPDVEFVVTGGTEEQVRQYQDQARLKQVENINFLGWILPRDRLSSLFQAADILAHPHLSGKAASFTNPVKFFQYLASGTPIVATNIGPLKEFQLDSLAIAWCEPDRPMAFSECLQEVFQKYPRQISGYPGNIALGREFSWENRMRKILFYARGSR